MHVQIITEQGYETAKQMIWLYVVRDGRLHEVPS
jgi:hypothetical protein